MNRPTWATVIGVLGIIFGCTAILGAGQQMLMPKIFEMQHEMLSAMSKPTPPSASSDRDKSAGAATESQSPNQAMPNREMFNVMDKMLEVPPWYGTWAIVYGILRAAVGALYLFAAISLMQLKPSSIKLFYIAAGASIATTIANGVVAIIGLSFMSIAMSAGGIFGAVIDAVLIAVVATNDHSAFKAPTPNTGQTAA